MVSDVLGKGPRRMIEALIAGERDPNVVAEMALTRSRARIPELCLALEGGFSEHHAIMLRTHLDHVDHLSAQIEAIDQRLQAEIAPFERPVERLCPPGNHASAGKCRSGRARKNNPTLRSSKGPGLGLTGRTPAIVATPGALGGVGAA